MRALPYFVLGILLHLFTGQVQGQGLVFEQLSVKDGLSQRTVRSIVKDRHGFMWFGTWNGLCRYDGYSFKTYLTISGDTTSLSNNRVHYLHMDDEGVLWVSTFNAYVCRYNYDTDDFTRFKISEVSPAIREAVDRSRNLDEIWRNEAFLNENVGPFALSETKEHIVFHIQHNLSPPVLALTGFSVLNNDIQIGETIHGGRSSTAR